MPTLFLLLLVATPLVQDFQEDLRRANQKLAQGDYPGAIQEYTRIIAQEPQAAGAFSNRGLAKIEMGDADGALADLEEAVRINPNDPTFYLNRGKGYYTKGDLGFIESDRAQTRVRQSVVWSRLRSS